MTIKTTKRQGFSWDPDFKENVQTLRDFLRVEGEGELSNADLFLLCVAFGLREGVQRPVPPRRTDAVRLSYLQPEHFAMLKALAIVETKSSSCLLDEDEIYDIVEQYAAGGLAFLSAELESNASFPAWLTGELFKEIKLSERRVNKE
jgi:hypothetical protein